MRSSGPELHDLVCRILAAYRVRDDEAPANYSLQLAGHDPDQADAAFHFLYKGFTPVLRTTDPRRLMEGLVAYLDGHVVNRRDGMVRLDALALVGESRAVLAPADARHFLSVVERRLNQGGLRVLDRPWATLDPSDGHLVVAPPETEVDQVALDGGLAALGPARRAEPGVPSGRYRVSGWAFGLGSERAGPLMGPEAVLHGAKLAINTPAVGAQSVLDSVSRALDGVPAVALWVDDPADLARPFLDLAD